VRVPLSMVRHGVVRIININAGRGLRERLIKIGLVEGDVVEVIVNLFPGPVILRRNGMRLGLGAGMASKIIVQPLEVKR